MQLILVARPRDGECAGLMIAGSNPAIRYYKRLRVALRQATRASLISLANKSLAANDPKAAQLSECILVVQCQPGASAVGSQGTQPIL
jgi:hypothetical protein